MKEIIYNNFSKKEDTCFLLTDNEFFEAQQVWKNDNYYWCVRLEKLLSPKFIFAGTPDEDVGFEVLFQDKPDGLRKIFKRDNKYYIKVSFGGEKSTRLIQYPFKEEEIKSFILQEEYYQQKKYLLLN